MYILALETTGPVGSVAIIDEKKNILSLASTEEMNHLKELMPMAQKIIDKLGISKKEISAVAASSGPGSFTGIRIGVSTARAISQALGIPAIKVETLETFRRFSEKGKPVAVIFNARRGQVYGAVFDASGKEILKPGPYMLSDVLEAVSGLSPVFYGDGADAYKESLEGFEIAEEKERYQSADLVALCALEKYEKGQTLNYEELLPDYMREVEANQKLRDGTLAKERAAKLERLRNS